jgi:hypothetical protein
MYVGNSKQRDFFVSVRSFKSIDFTFSVLCVNVIFENELVPIMHSVSSRTRKADFYNIFSMEIERMLYFVGPSE